MPQPADESSDELTEEVEETDEEEETEEEEEEEETDEDEENDEKLKAIAVHEAEMKAKEDDEFAYDAQPLTNEAHDEAIEVSGGENLPTPPQSTKAPPVAEPFNVLKNDTHDEAVDIGDGDHIATPRRASPSFDGEHLKDQAHDAAFSISNASEEKHVMTPPSKPMASVGQGQGGLGEDLKDEAHDLAYDVDDGDSVSSGENDKVEAKKAAAVAQQQSQKLAAVQQSVVKSPEAEGDETSTDDEAGGGSPGKAAEKGLYDPAEYEHLHTSKEVKDLFQFITVYKAHDVEVEPKLHPFIPDYIPAIGDIDGFIKVPRPDGKQSNLGLTVLDEPGSNQSNASVVALDLAYHTKVKVAEQNVDRVEQAQNKSKMLDKWINEMQGLHQNKHRPTVTYSKPMPDLETLLQVWPADFEDLLSRDLALPPAPLDLDIVQYVRVVCALLDIPTYVNLVESVHVLLSLYSEFKANPHFQGGAFSNLPL